MSYNIGSEHKKNESEFCFAVKYLVIHSHEPKMVESCSINTLKLDL